MIDQWHHCYNLGWKGAITPESFAHPAKISRELANRIYMHALSHGWLRPGGVAIWVTKDFVRKGVRVPFGDQWLALCESRGFVTMCRHHAMLVEHYGEQTGLFGDATALTTSRKSFFRRLAESKGSPEINWEDVICVRKPL
jgi:hypothetical protein